MRKRLVLIRHATATGFCLTGDFDRPLSHHGSEQAVTLGNQLGRFLEPADSVFLVSSAKRTQQTFAGLSEHMDLGEPTISQDLYEATTDDLINLVSQQNSQQIMVVGHEPTISSVATYLLGDDQAQSAAVIGGVRPATAIVLDLMNQVQPLAQGQAELVAIVHG